MPVLFSFSISGNEFSQKENILYFLLTGFFITLYLPGMPVVNNLFIGLIFIFSFAYNTLTDKIRLLKQRPAIILMILFYLLLVISALVSQNQHEGWQILGMRSPLILFPVAIGTLTIRSKLKDRIMLSYSWTTCLAALSCIIYALFRYFKFHNAGFLYNDSLSEAVGKQSVYFSLMVTLALAFNIYMLCTGRVHRHSRWLYVNSAFLLVIHFLLASRTEIIILYGLAALFALYYVLKKRNIRAMILLVGMVVFCILAVIFFPKTVNRFRELQYTDYNFSSHAAESHYNMPVTADQWNGMNLRLAIWTCSWELCREHLFRGVPLGDKRQELIKIFQEKHFDLGVKTRRNTHNNYLDVLSNLGIGGLVIFLSAFFIIPVRHCIQQRQALGILVIAVFLLSLVTETYLDKSIGCTLLSFFIPFISFSENSNAR